MPVSYLVLPSLLLFLNNFIGGGGGQDTIGWHTNPSPEVYVNHEIQSDKSHQGVNSERSQNNGYKICIIICLVSWSWKNNISDVSLAAM